MSSRLPRLTVFALITWFSALAPGQTSRSFERALLLEEKGEASAGVSIGDLNRDRQLDVVVGFVESPGSIYFNEGKGCSFHEVPWNDGKGVVYGMVFSDVDGDGWPDIIAARSDAPNAIWFNKPGR